MREGFGDRVTYPGPGTTSSSSAEMGHAPSCCGYLDGCIVQAPRRDLSQRIHDFFELGPPTVLHQRPSSVNAESKFSRDAAKKNR
mmetsp:Transcript_85671/g.151739  ORF Transcript_85671/g.151739 Transcript_85671/m.151739 type:complete len:85 (-) Transcript_85671:387-641(-)